MTPGGIAGIATAIATAAVLMGCIASPPPGMPGVAARQRLDLTPVDLARPPSYGAAASALAAPGSPGIEPRPDPETALPSRLGTDAPEPAASGPLAISVEQAVLLALRHNRALGVQQLEPSIAETFEDIERAVFDPTLFVEMERGRVRRTETDSTSRGPSVVTSNDVTATAGMTQTLPTGTDLELSVSRDGSWGNSGRRQDEVRGGVTLTQALLRGASIEANLARIHQVEIDTLSSVYELRGFTEALIANVEFAYWDLVLAQRRIEIFQNGLAVARQRLDETSRRVQVGQLAETELAATRAEAALREQDLIDARSTMAKARLHLLQLMNPSSAEGWERAIVATEEPHVTSIPEDTVEDRVALALDLRPELNQARLDVERDRLEVVRTRNGLLPRLDLFMTLGKSGYAASFGDARSDIGGPSYDVSAGMRFEIPVGNRQASALHRGALLSREQSLRSLENLAQLVSLDVRTAYLEMLRARDQIGASTATRALQEEVLRAEQAKFNVGSSTAFSVAQAQRDLLQSQIDEVGAIVAYRKALIDLYRLEGSLLKRRGIEAPGGEKLELSRF
ncbi:MAG: TolC family protein [Alphaproteobacteria bacterium]